MRLWQKVQAVPWQTELIDRVLSDLKKPGYQPGFFIDGMAFA
jgi:hypothetical protein